MLKDSLDKKLSEKQLDNVQGGVGSDTGVWATIHCQHPGCNWAFQGPEDEVLNEKRIHTMSYGHSEFLMSVRVPAEF